MLNQRPTAGVCVGDSGELIILIANERSLIIRRQNGQTEHFQRTASRITMAVITDATQITPQPTAERYDYKLQRAIGQ